VIECVTHAWVPMFAMVVMGRVGLDLCVTRTSRISMISMVSKFPWLG
jgi:hypothetical protein